MVLYLVLLLKVTVALHRSAWIEICGHVSTIDLYGSRTPQECVDRNPEFCVATLAILVALHRSAWIEIFGISPSSLIISCRTPQECVDRNIASIICKYVRDSRTPQECVDRNPPTSIV